MKISLLPKKFLHFLQSNTRKEEAINRVLNGKLRGGKQTMKKMAEKFKIGDCYLYMEEKVCITAVDETTLDFQYMNKQESIQNLTWVVHEARLTENIFSKIDVV